MTQPPAPEQPGAATFASLRAWNELQAQWLTVGPRLLHVSRRCRSGVRAAFAHWPQVS